VGRRGLIAGGIAVASALIAAPMMLRSTQRHVRKILEEHFGRDIVSGEAAERFIADIARKIDEPSGWYGAVMRTGAMHYHEVPFFRRKVLEIEDLVLTQFLKRTNAYRCYLGADEELVYVSLDPYEVGCGNFLSAQFKLD
jgi:hypothetical protein